MPESSTDTIAAISTAPGRAGISVVRVSGPATAAVAEALGLPELRDRRATHAAVRHPMTSRILDRVLVTRFEAPASYTGEHMLEIGCHGGSIVPQTVLDGVCAAGARMAAPGEFTRRAFLNGKMDLVQAEATADLIDARSPAMQRAALFQLERGLSTRVERLRTDLIQLRALLAYDIDFPEEDEGPVASERIDGDAAELADALEKLLLHAPEGELLREGALTVIAGRPNAGKSSLFNALVGHERAIVTEIPGTTRDAIEALVSVQGYPYRLVDTAGLRDDAEQVEERGIEIARSYMAGAEILLFCAEAGRALEEDELRFLGSGGVADRAILIRTKADLVGVAAATEAAGAGDAPGGHTDGAASTAAIHPEIPVSVITGQGLEILRARMLGAVYAGIRRGEEAPLVTRGRHTRALRAAHREVEEFRSARAAGLSSEIAITHLEEAGRHLEELLGVVTTEDVLDVVFGSFCVGK